jgi:hypothetical protein
MVQVPFLRIRHPQDKDIAQLDAFITLVDASQTTSARLGALYPEMSEGNR